MIHHPITIQCLWGELDTGLDGSYEIMTTEPSNLDRLISATKLNIQGNLAALRKRKRDREEELEEERRDQEEREELDMEDEVARLEEYHSQSLALL